MSVVSEIVKENPDVVLLQECPSPLFDFGKGDRSESINTFNSRYILCGSAKSHCGYSCIYVRREWKCSEEEEAKAQVRVSGIYEFKGLPAAGVVLEPYNLGFSVCIIGMHLAPYKVGAGHRRRQMAEIGQQIYDMDPDVDAVVLAGDSNMRQDEATDRSFADFRFPLRHMDYHGMSWNGKINKYHGHDQFEFVCQFDRVFLGCCEQMGDGHFFRSGPDVEVQNTKLIGNKQPELANARVPGFYLSDHFGLAFDLVVFQGKQL